MPYYASPYCLAPLFTPQLTLSFSLSLSLCLPIALSLILVSFWMFFNQGGPFDGGSTVGSRVVQSDWCFSSLPSSHFSCGVQRSSRVNHCLLSVDLDSAIMRSRSLTMLYHFLKTFPCPFCSLFLILIRFEIGNHELYNFNWAGLIARLQRPEKGWQVASLSNNDSGSSSSSSSISSISSSGGSSSSSTNTSGASTTTAPLRPFYFSWQPAPGWRFVMLNAYEVSVEQATDLPGYQLALQVC